MTPRDLDTARRRLNELIRTGLRFASVWDAIENSREVAASLKLRAEVTSAAEPVEVHFQWRPQLPDPADELILEAAVNGRADAIVTHNVRDFQAAAKAFGMPVLTPAQVLQELKR